MFVPGPTGADTNISRSALPMSQFHTVIHSEIQFLVLRQWTKIICRTHGGQFTCVEVCCGVLQCVVVCCSVLQCVAVCCSVLQCVAVCWSVMQCVAVWCSLLQCVSTTHHMQCVAVCCSHAPHGQHYTWWHTQHRANCWYVCVLNM